MTLFGSVHARVAAFAMAAGGALVVVAILGIDTTARMYHQEANQRLHLDLAKWLVEHYHFERDGQIDEAGIQAVFGDAMRVNPTIEAYLLDGTGQIIAFNAPRGHVKLMRVDLAPITQFLASTRDLPILGSNPRNPDAPQVFSVARIRSGGATIGYLYVVVGGEQYQGWVNRLRVSHILQVAALGAGIVILAGLLAGLGGFWFFTRRITRLSNEMALFRVNGFVELPAENPLRGSADELDQLREHFRMLAQVIHEQLHKLRVADLQLREAIAALSHDLQTPLTALGGYLDTLRVRGDAASSAERQGYLELAATQHRRVTRMVSAQFELSVLDSAALPFDSQPGSMSDLVNDVAQEFGATAATAGVTIAVDAPLESVMVLMDVALMQRVLENLVSNAIRHTPDGGRITISMRQNPRGIVVCVADTGAGIPAEDLPRIFDRSFRVIKSSRAEGEGAGLGLAIAKRILELHGGTISVDSVLGAGTRFCFEFPLDLTNPPSRP